MPRFKLVFFAPVKNTSRILNHIFAKMPNDVGKIGEYQSCAFMTRGTGQFLPGSLANPTVGKPGQLEFVEEDRVEVVVSDKGKNEEIRHAVEELKRPFQQSDPRPDTIYDPDLFAFSTGSKSHRLIHATHPCTAEDNDIGAFTYKLSTRLCNALVHLFLRCHMQLGCVEPGATHSNKRHQPFTILGRCICAKKELAHTRRKDVLPVFSGRHYTERAAQRARM
ncbi:hypothetical protein NM688_g6606 [Phlebia brevispora]|uniref:Uncharacterized protein n=1 Tax=Phlebia brevispora TaxID=194682 RepID=A0ACC1SE62_9APHY|nr:hypothetical protein NM688_g6606 [Phlebia brevispora]